MSLGAMSPEALTISMMVSSESQSLNLSQRRLSMLEEKLAKTEQAMMMKLRAKRMYSFLSLCLM